MGMTYSDGYYREGKDPEWWLELIGNVIADIETGIQNLRAGAYNLKEDYRRLKSDCEYYIDVGEKIVQLANKLKGIDELTDNVIEEIEDFLWLIDDAATYAIAYYHDRLPIRFTEDFAYYVMNAVTSTYRYPNILWRVLTYEELEDFESEVSDVMDEFDEWFYDEFTSLIGFNENSIRAYLTDAYELLEDYVRSGDKSLLDELIEVGKTVIEFGNEALRVLDEATTDLNDTIIDLLEWLRELLQNAYEELKRSVGSE